ncbi:MAG: transcription termination/antitermination protein NusG [Candidatus Omnitrophota bacterium]|jgi:transcriptional antiterminator NusG
MEKHWYVIHALTGQEEKVKANILSRIELSNLKDKIFQVLIPTEVVSEVKSGKKRISERKFFPGYVLVEMELSDESWYLIKNTPGVTGFISSGDKPTPLQNEEVENILKQSEEKKEKPMPKVTFNQGESVRIKEGPFTNFNGTIEELNPARGKLKVLVMIFGRSTPVELEYWQVERL